jgi:hypothetical protein
MNSFQAVGWPFANTEFTKVWSIPKFPMFNIEALLEVHRKNVAAWTQANRVVFEGLTTFAQRERVLLQTTVDDYASVTRDLLNGASVKERATKQVEGAGRIYASRVAHFVDLSNVAVKTNVSAVDILNARVTEMFDEFRALFAGRGTTATTAEPSISVEPVALIEEVALNANVGAAVPSTASGTAKSAPRTARAAKASKTSASGSKATSKTTARAVKATRRGTSRKRTGVE